MFFKSKKAHEGESIDALRIIDDKTPFAIRESFKSLYVNMIYLPIEDKCKKIAITSAMPGEGKTNTAINLAITTAQNSDDRKVLLIDMDMRKSTISLLLDKYLSDGDNKAVGLSEYLTGITEEANIIQTKEPSLYVLFAGKECVDPAGLILSKKFQNFLIECEKKFDFILIDTPPMTVVSDAALLADKVHGYFISTRADYSTTSALSNTVNALNNVGAKIYGIVYTDENMKKGKGYGKYGRYSSYSPYSAENN